MTLSTMLNAIGGFLVRAAASYRPQEEPRSDNVRVISAIEQLPPELFDMVLEYNEPTNDTTRWQWFFTMANVSKSFREHMMRKDFCPTFLCISSKKFPPLPGWASPHIKLSKEGRMTLEVGKSDLINLNVEALKALIEVPGMSKVEQDSIHAIVGCFELGLSRVLPQVKQISFNSTCLRSAWYIESPSPLQFQHESSLQHLVLEGVIGLKAEKLNVLLGTIGSNLKTLELFQCSNSKEGDRTISDAVLNVIVRHCHQLESFTVNNSERITANGTVSILQSNRLIELKVRQCNSIDGGEFARVLARDGRQLQTLDLQFNGWVTDSVLNGIVQALPELHTVFLAHQPQRGMTADGMRRALEQSSTLGRGHGIVLVYFYGNGEEEREEWENLVEEFRDVNFTFYWQ